LSSADTPAREEFARAVQALRQGRLQETVDRCQDYLVGNPGSVPYLQLLSHALIRQGDLTQARRHLELALSIAPDYAALHADLGGLEGMLGHFDAAVERLQKAAQLDPTIAGVHKKLARALADAGRHGEIDGALEHYLDHDEDAALVATGVEHYRAQRDDEAGAVLVQALRKNPENVNAMRFLAMVYRRGGQKMDDAEALLRKATDLAPDFHQALADLGQVLIDNRKYDDSIAVYRKLVALQPTDEDAVAGLGRAYALLGDVESACQAFCESIRLNSETPGTHLALGHMLKTLGRQPEALASYRHAIRTKPDLAEGYWSMANLKRFRFPQADVDAMEEQLQSTGLTDQARVHFEFALGKACEDQQDFARAWTHYHQGNQLQRQRVEFDPVHYEAHLREIMDVFDEEFARTHRGSGHPEHGPIFIIGLPRSGSTLVEQILASHSQVEGTAELPNLATIATGTGKYRHDGLQYPQTVRELTHRDFAAYGKEYLKQVARHRVEGTPFFIDKMPNNFSHVGWIRLTLPNAKIINTRRHPLDSCLGAYKQLFAQGQTFTYDMLELSEFYRSYVTVMKHWHAVFPGAVLDVHYEDTVTDLEGQVRRLLEFCGLPFEDQCLRYHETARAVKTASSEQVREPIYSDALGLWKKYGAALDDWKRDLADIVDELPDSVKAAAN
jgi:tetratricopeptide (TPR) repeat protein